MDSRRRQRSIALNHIPPLPIPHGLEYPLGSRMHLGVVHPRPEARGQRFPRSPRSCSGVNLRVLRPLTRGCHGQPTPLRTPHSCPGVWGIFPTSRGQAPHGWLIVPQSMPTGFLFPRRCCLALSAIFPCSDSFATLRFPVPLCLIPSPSHSPRPVFIPHRVASNPVARAHRNLIHPGTVPCSLHWSLLSHPLFPRSWCVLLTSPG